MCACVLATSLARAPVEQAVSWNSVRNATAGSNLGMWWKWRSSGSARYATPSRRVRLCRDHHNLDVSLQAGDVCRKHLVIGDYYQREGRHLPMYFDFPRYPFQPPPELYGQRPLHPVAIVGAG